MTERKTFHRLPTAVVPTNYVIRLHPDLVGFTFAGHENIRVDVRESVKAVTVNCLDIEIKTAKFNSSNVSLTGTVSYSVEDETATISFPDALPIGSGQLSLDFVGELNDKMKGFYRSKYTHPNGETRYAAATQFEPTDARRAFPCWDEPAVKATFDITLVAPKDRVALSNMNVVETTDHETDSNLKIVRYAQSPIMSTYLLAFVVGEYDFIEEESSDGVCVRVYTPLGKSEQGKYALEVAVKTLPFYKEYFGIAYPLPKMDLITIADFAAGAMENWGLITYRETALLVDPQNTSTQAKQWVALVVGHEIAHMWFGNLVTMEWWTHLWLNEGFATFVEYLCVDHCFPEYNIWNQFVAMDLNRALELDALKNSHPIEVPVGHPSEIDEIFDLISYSKGASVIRMLHNWIGDQDFRKGMNIYLNKFKYKNAATGDLWESLEEASGKQVGKVMHTWTAQMGFPVLKVTDKQEGSSRVLEFTQTKFSADGETAVEGDAAPLWLVPVSISCGSKPGKTHTTVVLDKRTVNVKLDNVGPTEWIKVNPGQVGVYRVHYSTDMLSRLLPAIKSKTLPARDRLGLANDQFALSNTGVSSTVEYLRLVESFTDEDEYTVWLDIAGNLHRLGTLLTHTDYESAFEAFNRRLFQKIGMQLGWDPKENEGHSDSLLRSLVISRLGRNGHKETVTESHKRLEAHASGKSLLLADLRSPIYSIALKTGDERVYETLLNLFRSADLHEEKMRVARVLGSTRDAKLIERTLNFAISDEIRSQDTVFIILSCSGCKLGRDMVWQFVQDKWQMLHESYQGGFLLSRLVKSSCEDFASEEKAKEIEAFFAAHPAPAAERSVKQAVERVRLNTAWLARDSHIMKSWLQEREGKTIV